MRSASTGFTLIELAVVIAIIAILAAVGMSRLMDTTGAERALAQDFTTQLLSGAAMSTASTGAVPTGFTDYVTTGPLSGAPNNFTVSTSTLGPNAPNCTVGAANITCTPAFNNLTTVTYTFNAGGIITANIAP